MRVGIVTFPGSTCDQDVLQVVKQIAGQDAGCVWHEDRLPAGLDAVVLPSGPGLGDLPGGGAPARPSPVMEDVVAYAKRGGPVLGIAFGFQLLCAAGLLPGAVGRGASSGPGARDVSLKVEGLETPVTRGLVGRKLTMSIALGEGNYLADEDTLDRLENEGRVVFRFAGGAPDGAVRGIAGICGGLRRNVVGLMPHPERAAEDELRRTDGLRLFEALLGA